MKYRSTETELMDDFDMEGAHLAEALEKIAWINRILGGNRSMIKAVIRIARTVPEGQEIRIVDLGCGNGDMLRALYDAGRKKNIRFRMTGIDANAFTVKYAEKLSASYPHITYDCHNVLSPDFVLAENDIVLLALTLHHFSDLQILQLMDKIVPNTKLAIVVNDLQRSRLSYWLFSWMSRLLRFGAMNDNDGKISIQRGFTRKELQQLSRKMNFKKYTIRWKWAFRYSWVITDL